MKQEEVDMIAHAKRGAMTLCLGVNTGENIVISLAVAEQIAKTLNRGKVLYLNTVQSHRQLATEIRKHILPDYSTQKPDPRIQYDTCAGGTLNSMDGIINKHISSGVKFIIINSLEFSSKDYRRKEDLLFQIKIWANEFDVGIILFGERVKSLATSGKIQRGTGAGKFACVAAEINYISEPTEAKDEEPDDLGMTTHEWKEAKRLAREEEVRIANEEYKKAEEEKELIFRAEQLIDEADFMNADIPVWKAYDEHEEKETIKNFKSNYVQFVKHPFESKEHYHKRLMAAIAVDIDANPKIWRYAHVRLPICIVHANNPEIPFEEELLPEGSKFDNYYFPDHLPIPGERKPRIKKSDLPDNSVRELFT